MPSLQKPDSQLGVINKECLHWGEQRGQAKCGQKQTKKMGGVNFGWYFASVLYGWAHIQ